MLTPLLTAQQPDRASVAHDGNSLDDAPLTFSLFVSLPHALVGISWLQLPN